MPGLLETVDPNGLEEFSVVFTDRSLNHMSQKFQQVMRDISDMLKGVYNADGVAGLDRTGCNLAAESTEIEIGPIDALHGHPEWLCLVLSDRDFYIFEMLNQR